MRRSSTFGRHVNKLPKEAQPLEGWYLKRAPYPAKATECGRFEVLITIVAYILPLVEAITTQNRTHFVLAVRDLEVMASRSLALDAWRKFCLVKLVEYSWTILS
jgi:hypothetical protein